MREIEVFKFNTNGETMLSCYVAQTIFTNFRTETPTQQPLDRNRLDNHIRTIPRTSWTKPQTPDNNLRTDKFQRQSLSEWL